MIKERGPLREPRLIRSLHYLEAVARHQSLKLAAEELGVSQSAVSHQLRELTTKLGEQPFIRSGRGIALTPTGQRLADKLAATFSGLQSSLDDVVGSNRPSLRLAVCSSFGPVWAWRWCRISWRGATLRRGRCVPSTARSFPPAAAIACASRSPARRTRTFARWCAG